MNIIIPKSEDVKYFVLDMRDALLGKQITKKNFPEYVVVVPRKYLIIDSNGKYNWQFASVFFKNAIKNYDGCTDLQFLKKKLFNFYYSSELKNNIIEIPEKKKSISVSIPCGLESEESIKVIIKNPIKEIGETEKFIDVKYEGIQRVLVKELDKRDLEKKQKKEHQKMRTLYHELTM